MTLTSTTTTTTTTILWLSGFCSGQPGWAGTRRNIHPLTPTLVINHPLSASSIYYDPWHPSHFNLRAWQSFCTTALQVLFGLPQSGTLHFILQLHTFLHPVIVEISLRWPFYHCVCLCVWKDYKESWWMKRINGIIEYRLLYSSCVQSSMLHGSETWPVRKENEVALQRAELRMVRWMCGIKLQDRVPSKGLRDKDKMT